ncbi:MAG: hypothetical protein H6744_21405 [Deltaproteobacteria bacterium]|nr:hypothetical protein [Deltaproteobacteria bacterium]MCB9789241.1 hypothetical protein [Deltaproteobacteria bacterium]
MVAKPEASEPAPASTTLSQTYEPQKSRPSVWSWVLLGTGVAALATGAGMLVDAKVKRDSVHSAIDNARAGFVTDMSLTDAEGLESDANRNAAIGVATLATGGALAVTGLVVALVTRGRTVEQGVSFGAQPRDGGAMFSASGRF